MAASFIKGSNSAALGKCPISEPPNWLAGAAADFLAVDTTFVLCPHYYCPCWYCTFIHLCTFHAKAVQAIALTQSLSLECLHAVARHWAGSTEKDNQYLINSMKNKIKAGLYRPVAAHCMPRSMRETERAQNVFCFLWQQKEQRHSYSNASLI